MKYSNYTAVIIGSGISGLYAALKLEQQKQLPQDILIITKSNLKESNSYYAQGGMVAVLKENKNDSVELHTKDTIKAGAGLSEPDTVKFISENSDRVVKDLLNFGVDFDRDENGNFTLTKEAAHSVNRILHSGGDATGREIEIALCNAVSKNKNIKIYENTVAAELLVKNNKCAGVIVFNDKTKSYEVIYTKALIIATGGLGQLYEYTTNPQGATGDGFALCYRAGVLLQDMEFVQFHPTALAIDTGKNRFLISEALRGEGAKLCDEFGIRFMRKYHEKEELAPRDIVARSIYCEMNNNADTNVYLDATSIDKDKLLKRFPTIAKKCLEYGIDITTDLIPVAPASHYFMGGIKTNICGQTNIDGLYAIGEAASTGLHGANRLASNSLLECVVCAFETAKFLLNSSLSDDNIKNNNNDYDDIIEKYEKNIEKISVNVKELKSQIQSIMWTSVGIFRNEKTLTEALNSIEKINKNFKRVDKCQTKEEYELRNMLITAKLIILSALKRKESRGSHYRTDYLNTNDEIKHSIITKIKGEAEFVE